MIVTLNSNMYALVFFNYSSSMPVTICFANFVIIVIYCYILHIAIYDLIRRKYERIWEWQLFSRNTLIKVNYVIVDLLSKSELNAKLGLFFTEVSE